MSNRKKGLILIAVAVALVIGVLILVTVRGKIKEAEEGTVSNSSVSSEVASQSEDKGKLSTSEIGKISLKSNVTEKPASYSAQSQSSIQSSQETSQSGYTWGVEPDRDKYAPALTREEAVEAAKRVKELQKESKDDEIKYITMFKGSQIGKINNAFYIMMMSKYLLYNTPEECGINKSFYERYAGGSPVGLFGISDIGIPGKIDEKNQIMTTGIDGELYVFNYTLDNNGNVNSITMNGIMTSVEREMQQTFDYDDYNKLTAGEKAIVDSTRKEIMARYGVSDISETKRR